MNNTVTMPVLLHAEHRSVFDVASVSSVNAGTLAMLTILDRYDDVTGTVRERLDVSMTATQARRLAARLIAVADYIDA
jgi:hypothetical protein